MKIAVIGDLIMDIKGFYREEIRAGKNILLKNIRMFLKMPFYT